MIPLLMRVRAEDEERERAQALHAANRCGPAIDDPLERFIMFAAVAVGLALVIALLWR